MPSTVIIPRAQRTRSPCFYVPMNLDPQRLRQGRRQLTAYLLNLIHWKWVCWQADANGWVRLKQEYLAKVIPLELLEPIRGRLMYLGVIHWDQSWTPGVRSQGYRIDPEFRETKRIECTSPELARRIEQFYRTERGPELPVHRWLADKLNLLDFDLTLADRIIPTLKPDADGTMPLDEYRDLLTGTAQRLANKDHQLTCDRFGRVHTLVTRLVKELRPCLHVGGQPLVGLDLANSQPLIAGIVARQYFASGMKAMRLRDRTFAGSNPYNNRFPNGTAPSPGRPDLERYIAMCQEAGFHTAPIVAGPHE